MSHVGKRPRQRRGPRGRRRRAGLCLGRQQPGSGRGPWGTHLHLGREGDQTRDSGRGETHRGLPRAGPTAREGRWRGGLRVRGDGRPRGASPDRPLRQTPQLQTAPLSPPMTFCTLSGHDPAPPESVVGWLGWRCAHLSRPPTLGHLVEPEPGDSFGARLRLVRGPWRDRLCPTFCDRSRDPRSTAPTPVWSRHCPMPLLAPAPASEGPQRATGPRARLCSWPATLGPKGHPRATSGGAGMGGRSGQREAMEVEGRMGGQRHPRVQGEVGGKLGVHVCKGTGVGRTQICDVQEKQYSALRSV